MKTKILLFEAAGILISLAGGILLVAGFLPIINPEFLTSRGREANLLSPTNLTVLAIACVILVAGVTLNRKAKSLKSQSENK
jgi:uncharacterized membrane protein YozB (DUF420 family)